MWSLIFLYNAIWMFYNFTNTFLIKCMIIVEWVRLFKDSIMLFFSSMPSSPSPFHCSPLRPWPPTPPPLPGRKGNEEKSEKFLEFLKAAWKYCKSFLMDFHVTTYQVCKNCKYIAYSISSWVSFLVLVFFPVLGKENFHIKMSTIREQNLNESSFVHFTTVQSMCVQQII